MNMHTAYASMRTCTMNAIRVEAIHSPRIPGCAFVCYIPRILSDVLVYDARSTSCICVGKMQPRLQGGQPPTKLTFIHIYVTSIPSLLSSECVSPSIKRTLQTSDCPYQANYTKKDIMASYYSQMMDYSGVLYTSCQSSVPPSTLNLNKPGCMAEGVMNSCDMPTDPLFFTNGSPISVQNEIPTSLNSTWTTSVPPYQQHIVTPPPESEGFHTTYPYPWQSCDLTTPSFMPSTSNPLMHRDNHLSGSSLEESPLSSPGSSDGSNMQVLDEVSYMNQVHLTMPLTSTSQSPICDSYGMHAKSQALPPPYDYSMMAGYIQSTTNNIKTTEVYDLGPRVPKGVKMPQRKGGIQLWQFLYALLADSEKKNRDIIEWTSNIHEKEFRMLEPESIAIWWGHHKNKPNMSYDKFSRSLRYYYDKGILKKIPGERYVYRFLIDPEHMYRHIGISDCRPKVKSMPQAAKAAMTKYHKEQKMDSPIVTQEPETLESAKSSSIQTASPQSVDSSSSYVSNSLQVSGSIHNSVSTGNLLKLDNGTNLSMKRSKSLENTCRNYQFTPSPCSATAMTELNSFSPDHSHSPRSTVVTSQAEAGFSSSHGQMNHTIFDGLQKLFTIQSEPDNRQYGFTHPLS